MQLQVHSRGAEANPGGLDQNHQVSEAVHLCILLQWGHDGVCSSHTKSPHAWPGVQPRLPVLAGQPLEPKDDMSSVLDAILRVETLVYEGWVECMVDPLSLFPLMHEVHLRR